MRRRDATHVEFIQDKAVTLPITAQGPLAIDRTRDSDVEGQKASQPSHGNDPFYSPPASRPRPI
jgi:hypothetical protein